MIVEPARASDISDVVEHLGRTFAVDPSVGWILRRAKDPVALTTSVYRWIVDGALSFGHVDVARDGNVYLGSAVWLPPDAHLRLPPLREVLPLLPLMAGAGMSLLRYGYASSRVKLPFPAWHLMVIAVTEAARGKGVGSALLDTGLARCGPDAVKLEATSERSAALYESRGFIRLGEVKTPAPTPEIIMWRPARRSGA